MGVFANLLYSNNAVSGRRSVDQLEGASFFISKKTGSESRVGHKLVDKDC